MEPTYRQRLMNEINAIPESMIPKFYRVIHAMRTELTTKEAPATGKASLKGIWGNLEIDDQLLDEARKSLFSYERRGSTR